LVHADPDDPRVLYEVVPEGYAAHAGYGQVVLWRPMTDEKVGLPATSDTPTYRFAGDGSLVLLLGVKLSMVAAGREDVERLDAPAEILGFAWGHDGQKQAPTRVNRD
jgi:hypothetical protein